MLDDTSDAPRENTTEKQEHAITDDQRDRFLRSLEQVDERRILIQSSYAKTFRRVLQRPGEADDASSEFRLDSGSDDASKSEASSLPPDEWPSFIEWLESDEPRYWISGKPGSGKSTLMKFLARDAKTATALKKWRPGAKILSHFFPALDSSKEQNVRGFWSSLAHQRLSGSDDIVDHLLSTSATARTTNQPNDWSETELRDTCLEVLGRGEPVCLFLDGLDEVRDKDGAPELFAAVKDLDEALAPNLKICFACGPEVWFCTTLAEVSELKMHLLTKRGMHQMARTEISKLRSSLPANSELDSLCEQIENTFVEKADGVFIWLILALKMLRPVFENGDSIDERLSRIKGLPKSIESLTSNIGDLYTKLRKANSTPPEENVSSLEMTRFLGLVARYYQLRDVERRSQPLYLGQLAIAVYHPGGIDLSDMRAIDQSSFPSVCKEAEDAIGTCLGLLEVIERSPDDKEKPWMKRVAFIHRSAYEYLTTTREGSEMMTLSNPRFPAGEAYMDLARGFVDFRTYEPRLATELNSPTRVFNAGLLDVRWILHQLDRASDDPVLREKVINDSSKLYVAYRSEIDTSASLPINEVYYQAEFLAIAIGFECCETWTDHTIGVAWREDPYFLSSTLSVLLEDIGHEICNKLNRATGHALFEFFDSMAERFFPTIQRLIRLGASVQFIDTENGRCRSSSSILEKWLFTCALINRELPAVWYDWFLKILASLLKAIEGPLPSTLVVLRLKKDTSFLVSENPGHRRPYLCKHSPRPNSHIDLRNAGETLIVLEVSLAYYISKLLEPASQGTEIDTPGRAMLREVCNQVPKETLEVPESICVLLCEDLDSYQAGYQLETRHLDKIRDTERLWKKVLKYGGRIIVKEEEIELLKRELEATLEDGLLQPLKGPLLGRTVSVASLFSTYL